MDTPSESLTTINVPIRKSTFENILIQHEPFALLLIKYLYIQDFISLAQTSQALRRFIFFNKDIWRNFDVRPCTPEDVYRPHLSGQPPCWKLAGWRESLERWGVLMQEYQADDLWRRCYVPYYSQEMTAGFLRSIFKRQGPEVVKLNLDAMPVTRSVLFPLVKRLEGTMEELGLRFCLKLKREDILDLLEIRPTSTSSGEACELSLPKLKKLYIAGTANSIQLTETNLMSPLRIDHGVPNLLPTGTAYEFFQQKLSTLLNLRKLTCDVGACSGPGCENKVDLGVRSFEKCTRCLRENDMILCKNCDRWTDFENCSSCTRPYCTPCSNIVRRYTFPKSYEFSPHSQGKSAAHWICQACMHKDAPLLEKMISLNNTDEASIERNTCYSCETYYRDLDQGYSCPACKVFICCECTQSPDDQISLKTQQFMEHLCHSCSDPCCNDIDRNCPRQTLPKLYKIRKVLTSLAPPLASIHIAGMELLLPHQEVEAIVRRKTKEAKDQVLEEMRTGSEVCKSCHWWLCAGCLWEGPNVENLKDQEGMHDVLIKRWEIVVRQLRIFCEAPILRSGDSIAYSTQEADPEYDNDSEYIYPSSEDKGGGGGGGDGDEVDCDCEDDDENEDGDGERGEDGDGDGDRDGDEDEDDWEFYSHRSHSSVGSW